MIKFCKNQWHANRDRLEKALRSDTSLEDCDYKHLLSLVVRNILNPCDNIFDEWDAEKITVVDDGSYSGTLMFLIPRDTYCPSEYDYLLTYIDYGSCSGCDTLLGLQSLFVDGTPTDAPIKEYMMLCKDLVTNMIKPYNGGWRQDDRFDKVEDDNGENADAPQ